MLDHVARIVSKILSISSPQSGAGMWLQISAGYVKHFCPTFKGGVQVTAVRHLEEFTHIYSDLKLTTEFHLLDGPDMELATTDGRPTTGNRTAGM